MHFWILKYFQKQVLQYFNFDWRTFTCIGVTFDQEYLYFNSSDGVLYSVHFLFQIPRKRKIFKSLVSCCSTIRCGSRSSNTTQWYVSDMLSLTLTVSPLLHLFLSLSLSLSLWLCLPNCLSVTLSFAHSLCLPLFSLLLKIMEVSFVGTSSSTLQ